MVFIEGERLVMGWELGIVGGGRQGRLQRCRVRSVYVCEGFETECGANVRKESQGA